jgi:hypothetical protein
VSLGGRRHRRPRSVDCDRGYTYLTGRICGEPVGPGAPPRNYVTPGSPEFSQLVYQLRGAGRDRMPPDGALPEVEIALIERWILEGAPCE